MLALVCATAGFAPTNTNKSSKLKECLAKLNKVKVCFALEQQTNERSDPKKCLSGFGSKTFWLSSLKLFMEACGRDSKKPSSTVGRKKGLPF